MSQTLRYLILALLLPTLSLAQKTLSLAGEWEVAFDADDAGSHQMLTRKFPYKITLPGTTDQARLGDSSRVDPALTRESLYQLTRAYRYVGTAWYRRTVTIPAGWKGKQIALSLERVLWQSRVFVDGSQALPQQESLTTPHRYDLTTLLTPGTHTILLRINNTRQYDISYQNLAHAYTDGTQTIWNGAIGRITLTAHDPVSIRQIRTDPDTAGRSVKLRLELHNRSGKPVTGRISLNASLQGQSLPENSQTVEVDTGKFVIETSYSLAENWKQWDEFAPNVYRLTAAFSGGDNVSTAETTFGLRRLDNHHSLLHINGRPLFLRGTLESAIFPLTGHPPVDPPGWLKVFTTAKAYGLNHLRFHSWCPPEAAFAVADSMGFYLQVELPVWSLQVGEDAKADGFLTLEAERISREYGNHPSFCFWSMGNELEGNFQFLNTLVSSLKKADNRHLYATTTYSFQPPHGRWPEPSDDYFITQQTKLGWVRGQGVFNQQPPSFKVDFAASIAGLPVPLVTHEVGQYALFPRLAEIEKYTGVMKPLNLIAIRNDLKKKGMLHLAEAYTQASGKLAAILYKEEIERILRTKGASGIQLLDLHDFPGQGTADIGLLDAFWDSKGILSAAEFRKFCGPVVPLLRFEKATFSNSETFRATAELANFGPAPLTGITPEWKLADESGKVVAKGSLATVRSPVGNGTTLGNFEIKLARIRTAQQLTLTLSLKNTSYTNDWHIWVYPEKLADNTGKVLVTRSQEEAMQALSSGRTVLFNPDYQTLKGVPGKFVPVFWSPVHFPAQAGTTGILCDPKHPAFRNFPTGSFTDWQWWDLCTKATSMQLPSDEIPPIVRNIDNFANNRQLASIFEARVGTGKLVVCSFDISSDLGNRIVARQLRHSLLAYMNSADFAPAKAIQPEQVIMLVKNTKKD